MVRCIFLVLIFARFILVHIHLFLRAILHACCPLLIHRWNAGGGRVPPSGGLLKVFILSLGTLLLLCQRYCYVFVGLTPVVVVNDLLYGHAIF